MSEFSFKSQAGTPSGPEGLPGLRAMSFFRTQNSATVGVLLYCAATEIPGSNGVKETVFCIIIISSETKQEFPRIFYSLRKAKNF